MDIIVQYCLSTANCFFSQTKFFMGRGHHGFILCSIGSGRSYQLYSDSRWRGFFKSRHKNFTRYYRESLRRKLAAYELYMLLGLISQGVMQYLSLTLRKEVWGSFHSWMRTMNTKSCPSERVVQMVMRERLPEFLQGLPPEEKLKKFLADKVDWSRCPSYQLASNL